MKKKTIEKDEVLHLARLSQLNLTEEELEKFSSQLGETIDYINNLNELNTEKVFPTSHVTNLENIFFDEDKINNQRGLDKKEIFKNTSHKKNGYFIVKRIL